MSINPRVMFVAAPGAVVVRRALAGLVAIVLVTGSSVPRLLLAADASRESGSARATSEASIEAEPKTEAESRTERGVPKALANAGVDEHLGDILPLDATFRSDRGNAVLLKDLFDGRRPVILSLNYSNCPMLCNLQLTGLVETLKELDWNVGENFVVASVSIDPLETPERASQTKQKYLEEYSRAGSASGWHFWVGNTNNITRLTSSVGYQYSYVPERREYAHPAVFVLCSPTGKLVRYVYGVKFDPVTLKLALLEASEGTIGTPFEKFLLFCFHYDAKDGRYTASVVNLMRMGGLATVVLILGGLGIALRIERRKKRAAGSRSVAVVSVA